MTGEPYAGNPPVRFGGRGGPKGPFLPLSGIDRAEARDNISDKVNAIGPALPGELPLSFTALGHAPPITDRSIQAALIDSRVVSVDIAECSPFSQSCHRCITGPADCCPAPAARSARGPGPA